MHVAMVALCPVVRVLQGPADDDRRLPDRRDRRAPSSAHRAHGNESRRDSRQDVRVVVRERREGLRSSEEPDWDLRADAVEHRLFWLRCRTEEGQRGEGEEGREVCGRAG